jgi:hypothetical protein
MSDDQLTPAPLVRCEARSGANLLVLAAALTPLLSIAAPCLVVHPSAAAPIVGVLVALFLLALLAWMSLPHGRGAMMRALLRWRLRRQLCKLLRAHGLDERDHSDRRRELERGFWRDQQRSALVALRQRFAEEPPRVNLLAVAMLQLRASTPAITGAFILVSAFTLCYVYWSIITSGAFHNNLRIIVGIMLFVVPISVIFMTGWECLRIQRTTTAERQEFVKESRRIATMAELAGGLTLAEDEVDNVLRGALSGDVAQRGALSEVDP